MASTVFQNRQANSKTETFQKLWYSSNERYTENKKRPLENYELTDYKIRETTEENPSKRRCIGLLSSKETNGAYTSEVKDIKFNIIETVQFSVDTGYNPQACYDNFSVPQEYIPSAWNSNSATMDNGYGERNTDKSYRPRYYNGKYCEGRKPYHTSNSGWQSNQRHTSHDYRQKHYTASYITKDAYLPVNSSKSNRRSGQYSIYDDDGYNVRGYYTSGFYPQL